jgi:hypothetical protein
VSKDVTPNFKTLAVCPCTDERCPREGTPLTRTYKDGTTHIRRCPCRQCLGRKSKRTGGLAQRTAAKRLGLTTSSIKTGHEESYIGGLRIEVKSGRQIGPLVTAFEKGEAQSEAQRPLGDNRPFVYAAVPEPNGKTVIYAFRTRDQDELRTVIAAFAEQLGLM